MKRWADGLGTLLLHPPNQQVTGKQMRACREGQHYRYMHTAQS